MENQKAAEERIPLLLQTPAAVRFLSCEPLLGPVDLEFYAQFEHPDNEGYGLEAIKGLDWVIVGGESGTNARPMHPDWAVSLRDQCEEYGVPFFFKQWGDVLYHSTIWNQSVEETNRMQALFSQAITSGKQFPAYSPVSNGSESIYKVGKKAAGRLLDGREWNEFPARS